MSYQNLGRYEQLKCCRFCLSRHRRCRIRHRLHHCHRHHHCHHRHRFCCRRRCCVPDPATAVVAIVSAAYTIAVAAAVTITVDVSCHCCRSRWHIPVFVPVCWGARIQDRIPVPAGIWRNPATTTQMFCLFYGPEPNFLADWTCFTRVLRTTYVNYARSNVCLPVKHGTRSGFSKCRKPSSDRNSGGIWPKCAT